MFPTRKARIVGLPEGKKKIEDVFTRCDAIHEHDSRTDSIGRGKTTGKLH